MENVSLVDGHIDNGITDEEIIKAYEICELKIKDMESVENITRALLLNKYDVRSTAIYKEFPFSGIDYFMISIFQKDNQTR